MAPEASRVGDPGKNVFTCLMYLTCLGYAKINGMCLACLMCLTCLRCFPKKLMPVFSVFDVFDVFEFFTQIFGACV